MIVLHDHHLEPQHWRSQHLKSTGAERIRGAVIVGLRAGDKNGHAETLSGASAEEIEGAWEIAPCNPAMLRRGSKSPVWPTSARIEFLTSEPMRVLGIETTCDETAAAVIERRPDGSGRILSNIVHSQIADHAPYGGVVPEIAARAHIDLLDGIIRRAMADAGTKFADLSAVAAAAGPGLIGGVIVGLTTAKAIAMVHDTPLIAVNHLEAHALTPRLTDALSFPYCLFLAS
ncbi:MAG TPA: hypothetical protein VGC55_18120, partial [Dokdonella sp.]